MNRKCWKSAGFFLQAEGNGHRNESSMRYLSHFSRCSWLLVWEFLVISHKHSHWLSSVHSFLKYKFKVKRSICNGSSVFTDWNGWILPPEAINMKMMAKLFWFIARGHKLLQTHLKLRKSQWNVSKSNGIHSCVNQRRYKYIF